MVLMAVACAYAPCSEQEMCEDLLLQTPLFDKVFNKKWFGKDNVVVVCLPPGGERYSASYAVDDETFCVRYPVRDGEVQMVQPLLEFLKDQCLLGFSLNFMAKHQVDVRSDFCVDDVDRHRYHSCSFYSGFLKDFLQKICPNLKSKRAYSDEWGPLYVEPYTHARYTQAPINPQRWSPLTTDVLDSILGGSVIRWELKHREDFLSAIDENKRSETVIFILLEGGCVVQGASVLRFFARQYKTPPSSALFCKMMRAKYALEEIYPYTPERAQKAINYDG